MRNLIYFVFWGISFVLMHYKILDNVFVSWALGLAIGFLYGIGRDDNWRNWRHI